MYSFRNNRILLSNVEWVAYHMIAWRRSWLISFCESNSNNEFWSFNDVCVNYYQLEATNYKFNVHHVFLSVYIKLYLQDSLLRIIFIKVMISSHSACIFYIFNSLGYTIYLAFVKSYKCELSSSCSLMLIKFDIVTI